MFNSSELSTAVRYGINVVTIVFRNDSYGNVARDLDDLFGGTYETDLLNPDFVKFAESFGAVGMRASDPMELETLIPLALQRQSPVVIDVPFGEMPISRAPQICVCLQSALDAAPGRPDNLLSVRSPLLRKRPDARRTAGCRRRRWA